MTEQTLRSPTTDPTLIAPMGHSVIEAVTLAVNSQAEIEPVPTYVTIEGTIEALEEESRSALETMDTVYEASSDEVKQKIDQLQEDYITANQKADGEGDKRPSLASFFGEAEDIPKEFKTALLAYEANTVKTEAAEQELEKYVPEKAAEVKLKALALEASLDYDMVVAQAYADDDDTTPFEGIRSSSRNLLYDVSRVIGVRRLLESGAPLTYQQLKSVERSLNRSATECKRKRLVREQGEVAAELEPVFTDEQMTDLEAHIKDVYELRIKYKNFNGTVSNKIQALLSLTRDSKACDDNAPRDFDELYTRAKIIYNDSLSVAINRRLAQKLKELPAEEFETDTSSDSYMQLIERIRRTDTAEALKKLEVSGSLEDLPFEFSEAELKQFLRISVPAIALASVKRIQFGPIPQEEGQDGSVIGIHRWSDELGGTEIIISDARVRKHYQDTLELFGDDPNAEQYAELSAKYRMLQTITHEFGHGLHESLPVAVLKRWEDQRATDPTNITEYVKRRHNDNHWHRYMEDFADTMALFINKPEILMVISSTRFDAMRQIFEEVMPSYPEILKKSQDHRIAVDRIARMSKGISDETVKSTYFGK